MMDCGLKDEKIIAVPHGDPNYNSFTDIGDLPGHIFNEMSHFLLGLQGPGGQGDRRRRGQGPRGRDGGHRVLPRALYQMLLQVAV
jgi:hypothetical protein